MNGTNSSSPDNINSMNTSDAVIALSKRGRNSLPQEIWEYILEYFFKAKMIACGGSHTIILTKDGTLFACGSNDHGQLGLGDTTHRNTFTKVPALPEGEVAKQVVAGLEHTMILAEDGTVFACGHNLYGQLGLGDDESLNTFTAVPPFPEGVVVAQIVAGDLHTMICAQDGTVFACGYNSYGELGLGDYDYRNYFTAVTTLPKGVVIKQVIAGSNHTMILAKDSRVFACGDNSNGQLGLGHEEQMITFTAVPTLPDGKVATQVIAGEDYTMIIAEDGTVFACGWNAEGQLGLGDTTHRNTFTEVTLPDGVVAVQLTSGEMHTMILAEDGTVFACGWNAYGQFGLGDTVKKTFTSVTLPEDVVPSQVVAGRHHTMIIGHDGMVFACGYNRYGQLGLGDYENKFTPVRALLNDGRLRNANNDGRDE